MSKERVRKKRERESNTLLTLTLPPSLSLSPPSSLFFVVQIDAALRGPDLFLTSFFKFHPIYEWYLTKEVSNLLFDVLFFLVLCFFHFSQILPSLSFFFYFPFPFPFPFFCHFLTHPFLCSLSRSFPSLTLPHFPTFIRVKKRRTAERDGTSLSSYEMRREHKLDILHSVPLPIIMMVSERAYIGMCFLLLYTRLFSFF